MYVIYRHQGVQMINVFFCLCKAITFNYITGLKVNKLIQIMIIANLPALENPCKVQHETLRQVHAADRKLLNIYHAWSQQVI